MGVVCVSRLIPVNWIVRAVGVGTYGTYAAFSSYGFYGLPVK